MLANPDPRSVWQSAVSSRRSATPHRRMPFCPFSIHNFALHNPTGQLLERIKTHLLLKAKFNCGQDLNEKPLITVELIEVLNSIEELMVFGCDT